MTIRRPRGARLVVVLLAAAVMLVGMACNDGGTDPVAEASPTEESEAPSPTGSPSETAPSPQADGDHPACEPAQRISDLDDEVTGALNDELTDLLTQIAAGEEPSDAQFEEFLVKVQTVVEEKVPDLIAAYDDFAATVPQNLVDDAEILREFTVSFTETLAQLTPEELENIDKLFQGPEALEAAGATFALDEFTQKECGIVLAD